LIKQKKTVIFVTSHYKYLDEVDANILLIKNGEIIDDDKQIDQYLEEEDEEDQEDIEEEEDVHSNNHHTKLVKQ
jgi:ABC-type multidrug transport system ATPase subunit